MEHFTFDDCAAYHEGSSTLILGDLHFGRTHVPDGQSYPETAFRDLDARLRTLVERHDPSTLVLNGDVFDGMPFPPEALDLIEDLGDSLPSEDDLVLLLGNHEDMVGGYPAPYVNRYTTKTEYRIPETNLTVFHGHRTPTQTADVYVINHVHPVVQHNGERRRCYAFAEEAAYGSDILILPAFSPLVGGLDIDADVSSKGHTPLLADGDGLSVFDAIQFC